jgi:hypothetical protein
MRKINIYTDRWMKKNGEEDIRKIDEIWIDITIITITIIIIIYLHR